MTEPYFWTPGETSKKQRRLWGFNLLIPGGCSGQLESFTSWRWTDVWLVVNCSSTAIQTKWQGSATNMSVAEAHERKGASSQWQSKNKVCVSVPTEGGCESCRPRAAAVRRQWHTLSATSTGSNQHSYNGPVLHLTYKQYVLLCVTLCVTLTVL